MKSFWVGLIAGLWLIVSPWLLGFSGISLAKWDSVFIGLILVLVFGWEIFGEREEEENEQQPISNF